MKRIKVVLDFIELSVAEKIVFCRNVVVKLKISSSIFANPDESMEAATSATDKLEVDYLAASGGGRAATAAMHASETEVNEIFRVLAAYVDRIAKGDETIILLSGFNTSKQPIAKQKAELAVVSGANSGTVKLAAKAIKGAGSYIWQYCINTPTNEKDWITGGFSTQASFEISGLTSASKYYFRFAAITSEGTTDFSTPVLKVVE